MRPQVIIFEGTPAAGATTAARVAIEHLRRHLGEDKVIFTREPGGSPGAEEIRRLLVEGDPNRWSYKTEILLRAAARQDHYEKTIWPALEAGKVVICDGSFIGESVWLEREGVHQDTLIMFEEHVDAQMEAFPHINYHAVILTAPHEVVSKRGLAMGDVPSDHEIDQSAGYFTNAVENYIGSDAHTVIDGGRPLEEVSEAVRRYVGMLFREG